MSGLLPVAEALARVLDGVRPTPAEDVPVGEAFGRMLAAPLAARRTQPPFDVSAMDGYALRAADATPGFEWSVIGTAPAGHPFRGRVGPGEAVRIFTGAALPEGADSVLLQEDAIALADGRISALEPPVSGRHIRAEGLDFAVGDVKIEPPRRLGMRDVALAAAMNHAALPVRRKPRVAILSTGDELFPPGDDIPEGGIVASNGFALAALVRSLGGEAIDLGIVRDDRAEFAAAVDRAVADSAEVLVTLGGASVGDHDLAREVLAARGMELGFWKIAMRPGKPLIFGRIGGMRVLGLPGNPVSSVVCSLLFLRPLVEALLGLPASDPTVAAILGGALRANDHRQDYLRARLETLQDGRLVATPFPVQDSSMLSTLASSGCLIVRPPHAAPAEAGGTCRVLPLP